MVWRLRWPSLTFSHPWWPSRPFSHTRLCSISLWIQIDKKIPKKRPKSSWQLRDFSVMFLTENQLFGSSAGSDLQAIRIWTEIWLIYPLCFSYQNNRSALWRRTPSCHNLRAELAHNILTKNFVFLFSFVARFESSYMYNYCSVFIMKKCGHLVYVLHPL